MGQLLHLGRSSKTRENGILPAHLLASCGKHTLAISLCLFQYFFWVRGLNLIIRRKGENANPALSHDRERGFSFTTRG
jgi:hypothetical protein